ncbi:hypothetical protein RMQ97_08845 [Maricaulis sp. D1M11]|uniref:hypothetical protein n=1 Tax=Maricaulis sp. D1M11 TaxID=3076117 RepID=UPI0039B5DFF7
MSRSVQEGVQHTMHNVASSIVTGLSVFALGLIVSLPSPVEAQVTVESIQSYLEDRVSPDACSDAVSALISVRNQTPASDEHVRTQEIVGWGGPVEADVVQLALETVERFEFSAENRDVVMRCGEAYTDALTRGRTRLTRIAREPVISRYTRNSISETTFLAAWARAISVEAQSQNARSDIGAQICLLAVARGIANTEDAIMYDPALSGFFEGLSELGDCEAITNHNAIQCPDTSVDEMPLLSWEQLSTVAPENWAFDQISSVGQIDHAPVEGLPSESVNLGGFLNAYGSPDEEEASFLFAPFVLNLGPYGAIFSSNDVINLDFSGVPNLDPLAHPADTALVVSGRIREHRTRVVFPSSDDQFLTSNYEIVVEDLIPYACVQPQEGD